MSRNDIIAEYIEENYPELLKTPKFSLFVIRKASQEFVSEFTAAINRIDFSKLKEVCGQLNKEDVSKDE